MRVWLETQGSRIITSRAVRDAARAVHAARRRMTGAEPCIHYFHGVGDPYSHLAVQMLPALAASYRTAVVPHLVASPDPAAAPEPQRLAAWSLEDCRRLAAAHGLGFPADARLPDPDAVAAGEAALAGLSDPLAFSARAVELGEALWSGDRIEAGPGHREAALLEGGAALAAAGHYLPAVFAFEGETYWGVDRLPHLEARLAGRREGQAPLLRQLEADEARGDTRGAELQFFLSFRSPYSWLAAARVRHLAERWNARLMLRPLLPMVMRGLPVPREKRMYIVRDAKREAERLGLPFGRICDPVGPGVERGLAVLHRAVALGAGPAFAESFLQGAWAEGVDATTDEGLLGLAARAGLGEADVRSALKDESWKSEAEANREELFRLGLWGVPSFRVAELPPIWGQDRLWAVQQDLRRIAERAT